MAFEREFPFCCVVLSIRLGTIVLSYYRTIVLNSRSGHVLVGTKRVLLVLFGFVLSIEIVLLVP